MSIQKISEYINKIGPYGLAAAVQAGSSFLILPLLLLLIGAYSYGRLALLEPLVAMSAQFLLLGAHQGIIHGICKENKEPMLLLKQVFIVSQFCIVPILTVVYFVVGYVFSDYWLSFFFIMAMYVEAINLLLLTTARAMNRSWIYFYTIFSRYLILLSLIFLSLMIYGRNSLTDRNAMLMIFFSTLGAFVMSLLNLRMGRTASNLSNATGLRNCFSVFFDMIRYGLPLVLAGLFQTIIAISDRYVLAIFMPPSAISAYVVAVKYANAMNLVATPFNLWWPTARFQHLNDADGGASFFYKTSRFSCLIYFAVAFLLIILSKMLLPILGPGVEVNITVVSLLLLAAFCYACQVVFNVGLLTAGHTSKNTIAAAISAAVYVALLFIFAPKYGLIGAASTAAVTSVIFSIITYKLSQSVIKIKQDIVAVVCCYTLLLTSSVIMSLL